MYTGFQQTRDGMTRVTQVEDRDIGLFEVLVTSLYSGMSAAYGRVCLSVCARL
jgi:hypothetical protein